MSETLTYSDLAFLAATAGNALTHPTFIDPRVAAEAVPLTRALHAKLAARAPLTEDDLNNCYGLLEVGVQEEGFYEGPAMRRAHALMDKLRRMG